MQWMPTANCSMFFIWSSLSGISPLVSPFSLHWIGLDSGFLQVRSREAYQKLGIFVRQAAGLLHITLRGLSILICLYFTWVHVYSVGNQEIPGVTGKFGHGVQNKAGQKQTLGRVLPREHTGHSKHPLATTQEMTLHVDITRWSTLKSDWLYSLQPKMEKLYTVSKKNRSWLWLRLWTPYCQI